MWWLLAIYVVGFVGTGLFNRMLIVGPVTSPLAVLRNALLWPVFLPILIYLARQ